MPRPEQGHIIEVEVTDPQSRNPKRRPVVVVSPTTEIKPNEPFLCVAISGTLPSPLTDDYVMLPYQREGHPRTGLKKKCAAVLSWLVEVREERIQRHLGVLPSKQLAEILAKLEKPE